MSIENRSIDIWHAPLLGDQESFESYSSFLSPEEREHADQFYEDSQRRKYIFARGTLRTILSKYCGEKPEQLKIVFLSNKKPKLKDHDLNFNLSHTQDLALYAISKDEPVGIDVEKVRTVPRWIGTESRNILQQWTVNEAKVKVFGSANSKSWFVSNIDLGPEFVASLATKSKPHRITLYKV